MKVDGAGCRFRGHNMEKVEAVLYPEAFGICANCGEPFKLGSHRRRFCSEGCANAMHQQEHLERQRFGEAKTCPVCGRGFKGRRDQACCSPTCGAKRGWQGRK